LPTAFAQAACASKKQKRKIDNNRNQSLTNTTGKPKGGRDREVML